MATGNSHQPTVVTFLINQWAPDASHLDALLAEHQSGQTSASFNGIRKSHWKAKNTKSKCPCGKRYGITDRQHHCRRCGGVFCNECTSYKRRLNIIAHPDPNGKLYKVCKDCFDQGPQEIGQTRSLTSLFGPLRSAFRTPPIHLMTSNGLPFSRSQINIHTECNRLTEGFRKDLQKSALKKAAREIKSILTEPEWIKSKNWMFENMAPHCRACSKTFGVFRSKNHCALCSSALCSNCVSKDVILYEAKTGGAVHIAVIKVIGCPEKEPDVCMYLGACARCKTSLEDIQVSREQENMNLDETTRKAAVWKEIIQTQKKLMATQEKIEKHLPEYLELIDALEIGPGAPRALPHPKGARTNTQVLAKAQGDLADHFTELVMTIHSLKNYTPSSQSQNTILKNIIKGYTGYYQENMYLFRESKKKLEEVTSPEVLKCIQRIVDRNAMNSCYVCVKQLCLEVLHVSTKYQIEGDLTSLLAQLEQVLEEDLKKVIKDSGEDYENHEELINQLLQLQLKDHRLIKSSRLEKAAKVDRLKPYINEKVGSVLTQVNLQLVTKVAHRSFTRSKQKLEQLIETTSGPKIDEVDGDWTLLDQ